ncbi:hypothetical protein AVENLUH5627_03300 [Acinetobacter venetianus]|uniref:Uncharacterized protein n=1 Tax=Acinetobacter venetianus TaxID=52133 RepID=A0A150HK18_9GAMM|nr:hypothetical protein AVENLUH5627_03300 [Acinetobacter venetianus]
MTNNNFKSWEQLFIEFLVRQAKPINNDLPNGWSILLIN